MKRIWTNLYMFERLFFGELSNVTRELPSIILLDSSHATWYEITWWTVFYRVVCSCVSKVSAGPVAVTYQRLYYAWPRPHFCCAFRIQCLGCMLPTDWSGIFTTYSTNWFDISIVYVFLGLATSPSRKSVRSADCTAVLYGSCTGQWKKKPCTIFISFCLPVLKLTMVIDSYIFLAIAVDIAG
jgi:hypothetical protein